MLKVFLTPNPNEISDDNGVGKVVQAQYKHLPKFGITFVDSPEKADVIASHVQAEGLVNIDVLHNHGLYFTADIPAKYDDWCNDVNKQIVSAARRARVITTPANWSAMVFKRDMRISPEIIYNGVDVKDWQPLEPHQGYVLWNKNNNKGVCDPTPAFSLAQAGIRVVTTFAPDNPAYNKPEQLYVVGKQPFDRMKILIQKAEVFLSTTREVMSVSVLEALASGVPVLGYDYGGTSEVIRHKVDGYLVKPGDIQDLIDGYVWLREHRNELVANCIARAKEYDWQTIIMPKYAELYKRVAAEKQADKKPTVAVVITNYNYAGYIEDAIKSCLAQTRLPDQIVVVDDGSTDNSRSILRKISKRNRLVSVIEQNNAGVANARNAGISATTCQYIICLDADDRLAPEYIANLLPAFANDEALGIAWTKAGLMTEEGKLTGQIWDFDYSFEKQTDPNDFQNGIPCAAMFKRVMWERAGGYKQVYHPAEDAEFWIRGVSLGFKAKRVSDKPLFEYRLHPSSASSKPLPQPIHTWHPWTVDKQYPFAVKLSDSNEQIIQVRSYADPLLTVVIPVGPGHVKYLPSALESLLGQTFRRWAVIVVNDTGKELPTLKAYPFVKIVNTSGKQGAGKARNVGLAAVKTPLVVWLDADDYLMPQALIEMIKTYAKTGKYVYTDWLMVSDNKQIEPMNGPEYSQTEWLMNGLHAVTVLMETGQAREVEGFDETMPGYEDWDFFIKLAIKGFCGVRLPEKLLAYRVQTGERRKYSQSQEKELVALFTERYGAYQTGVKKMAGCCGGRGDIQAQANRELVGLNTPENAPIDAVKLKYIGSLAAPATYTVNKRRYQGATDPAYQFVYAYKDDVDRLLQLGCWQRA